MLTYSFENCGKQSLYEYLYKCIKTDILSGELKTDDKLPSKRSFAKHLGISVITVENAYEQLIAEGYIYSLPKKGFFVSKVDDFLRCNQLNTEEKLKEKIEFQLEEKAKKEYFVDFTNNETNVSNFPFSTWAKLMREVLHDSQKELMAKSPAGGVVELRKAIASHLAEYRGINVSADQIIVGAGTEYLYGLLIQLLGFDKNYGVEDPGYDKIAKIYQSYQVTCEYISMDHNGLHMEELEKKEIDVMHISPSHHFPTGRIMPVSERYELLRWASQNEKRYIIEDDYDSEFRLVGQPIPALQNIDTFGKVIYMNTFSKSLTSTVRISYMVLPIELVKKFYQKLSFYSCTVSNFEQYTLARFIKEGHFEKHLNRMRTFYHGKRDLFLKAIKKGSLNEKVTILEEDSGLHFLLKINTDLTDETFCKMAEEKGIRIAALSKYYHEEAMIKNHIFIVNYSSLEEEKMEEAVKKIESVL